MLAGAVEEVAVARPLGPGSGGTVMSWLHRGRSALRVRLSTAS